MMEYAAFGFATLTWWTYLILLVVVFTSVYGAWTVLTWQEQRAERDRGPVPCLAHLGTEPDGIEWWCFRQDGHDGPHLNHWGVDPSEDYVDTDEGMHYCVNGCTLEPGHPGDHNAYTVVASSVMGPATPQCEWIPSSASPSCDWSRDCDVHGVIPYTEINAPSTDH